MQNKVFVIGLDGATLDIIRPLVRDGKLPNFSRLMKEGSFGTLKSTIPPITPCAWTSFATGKDPSKHGLYDFDLHEGDPENKKSVNRTFVKAKSLWRILSEAGKRSIVIDVPLTYPPEKISGYIISRVMAPPNKNCTYPKSLYRRLSEEGFIEKKEGAIQERHGIQKTDRASAKKRRRKLSKSMMRKLKEEKARQVFAELVKDIEKNLKLSEKLIRSEEWDFFMIVFMAADYAGHGFWHNQRLVKKIYEKLDDAVGKLLSFENEHAIKFIISDHGFTSVPYLFDINEWLRDKGFLHKKIEMPYKESVSELKDFLKRERAKEPRARTHEPLKKFRYYLRTDYSKSKAYLQSGVCYGIRINKEGRDKSGTVKKEDYEPFRNEIIAELKKITHPVTGKRAFSSVLKKEDVYSPSPFGIDPAPDIFILSHDMKVAIDGKFTFVAKLFQRAPKGYGFHHTDGIFFAEGEKINRMRLDSAKITDLAPTILHILNVPIPEDMDGRVLNEIFRPDSDMSQRKVSYQAGSAIDSSADEYSKKDERVIREKLAALGYVQ